MRRFRCLESNIDFPMNISNLNESVSNFRQCDFKDNNYDFLKSVLEFIEGSTVQFFLQLLFLSVSDICKGASLTLYFAFSLIGIFFIR